MKQDKLWLALSDSEKEEKQEESIRHEQIKLLYEAVTLSIIASVVLASILVLIQWETFEHETLIIWLISAVSLSFFRVWNTSSYFRVQPDQGQNDKWNRAFLIGSTLSALLWGATPIIMFEELLVSHQAFLTLVIAGISAGAVTSLSSSRPAVFSFLLIALLPLIIRFTFTGTEISLAMAIMITLFLVMMLMNSNRLHINTRQNIELRLKSQINEEALKASESRFRQLFEGNRSVELVIDPKSGHIIDANPAAEVFYGYSRKKLLSMNISGINTLSEEAVKAEMMQAESESRSHFFFKHRLASGEVRDVEVHSGPLEWNNSEVLYSIVHDVTARIEAQDRLRKLSQAIEQAGEAILIMNREGIIEYVNPAFTGITGYESLEAIGDSPKMLNSGHQSDTFYQQLWQTVSTGEIWQGAVIAKRKNGSLYPSNLSIAPIYDDKHEITHYVGIQQDMTEHQMLEDKFRQAQKMEALGTLVGGIAHDFNNMLAGITGNLYLAKKQLTNMPDVQQKLENIDMLSFRAAEMIKQLMTFARKGSVEIVPFGLTSFIKEVLKLSEAGIPENITFTINICPEEMVVKGDTTQLQQVIMNLLNNARDAVAHVKRPEIILTLDEYKAEKLIDKHAESATSRYARLVIQDNGCGISEIDKEHIFEPFFSTKEVGEGTGLGLSMVYGVLQSHEGFVDVESRAGKGAIFTIYLPLIEEKTLAIAENDSEGVFRGGGELIMLCDDNADVRETTGNVLESIGYRTIIASDGLEAVELYRAKQAEISIVIMDVVMPKLSGIKAAERIREIDSKAKVIFATGYDREETFKSEMPEEDFEVLIKPYDIGYLSRVIKKSLESE